MEDPKRPRARLEHESPWRVGGQDACDVAEDRQLRVVEDGSRLRPISVHAPDGASTDHPHGKEPWVGEDVEDALRRNLNVERVASHGLLI